MSVPVGPACVIIYHVCEDIHPDQEVEQVVADTVNFPSLAEAKSWATSATENSGWPGNIDIEGNDVCITFYLTKNHFLGLYPYKDK